MSKLAGREENPAPKNANAGSMKTTSSIIASSCVLLLCGCQHTDTPAPQPAAQERIIPHAQQEGAKASHDIKALTAVDEAPRMRFHPSPKFEYPASLKGSPAHFVLELQLTEKGDVAESGLIESSLPSLGPAAAKAALRAKFTPATVDGRPVPCRIRFKFTFTL